MNVARQYLAVAELADNFQDFRPGGVKAFVHFLVRFDGHDELKLLEVHFALFGLAAIIRKAATGAAAAFQAGVDAALGHAAIGAGVAGIRNAHLSAIHTRAAIDPAFTPILSLHELALLAVFSGWRRVGGVLCILSRYC